MCPRETVVETPMYAFLVFSGEQVFECMKRKASVINWIPFYGFETGTNVPSIRTTTGSRPAELTDLFEAFYTPRTAVLDSTRKDAKMIVPSESLR